MPTRFPTIAWLLILLLSFWGHASAEIDLRNAEVTRLDNGLTVILLEDRNFPVVSTQMLYRVGARDESYGQTGIAHFLEHMAFRDSKDFPGTGLVSSIYAVGGEWHGYTWTDQTTYFATVPKEHADLLLRIEAERMSRLQISRDDMEAERGAVLAEMHMYENYPTSMLIDAIMFASFQGHPYRNNTIGWESDIQALQYEEVVAFYTRYYQPANAVIAVVGDFDSRQVRARIDELFGGLQGRPPAGLPRTVEPDQHGERRVRLYGHSDDKRFMVAYRAPSANHPDFPAFLVLQEFLGAGSGVNFRQNDWGTPVEDGSVLSGVAADLTTWYPPSAQDYIFIVGGTIAGDAEEQALEAALEERLATVRLAPPDGKAVARAIDDVLDDLAFDVQTTEDAAHQLAYFDGLRALDVLLELPRRIRAVTALDVQRAAVKWLQPHQRTLGWYLPDDRGGPEPVAAPAGAVSVEDRPVAPIDRDPVPLPVVRELRGGVTAILQQSDISATARLQVVMRGDRWPALAANDPALGYSSYAANFRPGGLEQSVRNAFAAVGASAGVSPGEPAQSADPETRLQQVFAGIMGRGTQLLPDSETPVLIVLSGDIEPEDAYRELDATFGGFEPPDAAASKPRPFEARDIDVRLGVPVAQAQLGYIVPAPAPVDAFAWRILLYILSHDYEGRLGKEAISNRGLAYYIDSRYRSDGSSGWVTLSAGVDPGKIAALKDLLKAELARLRDDPPTVAEIEEAKRHFLGRARSAAQSNEELSTRHAEQWLWYGDTLTPKALDLKLGSIGPREVLDVVPSFLRGATVTVDR